MSHQPNASLPKIVLDPWDRWRLVLIGILVAFAVARTVPDVVRAFVPLGIFEYATDEDGVVTSVAPRGWKGQPLRVGDRVRLDRVKPFDRKPGLAPHAYTRENFDRKLPVERNGRVETLAFKATPEDAASRALVVLRIVLFLVSTAFAAIVVLVKPRVATLAFFMFTVGAQTPTTYTDVLFDAPWRAIPTFLGDILTGGAPVALLLFATSLSIVNRRARHLTAYGLAVLATALGLLHAYTSWRFIYQALPSNGFQNAYTAIETALAALNVIAFVTAFFVARGSERTRTGYILAAFALAGAGRLLSEHLFPAHLTSLENGVLLSLGIVPAIVVWIAVLRHHLFDVDFVVSRALVYSAITAAVLGVIGASEELLTYAFYNNTDLAYGFTILISLALGATFGRVKSFLDGLVDRFIFRERRAQQRRLADIAAAVLDADDERVVLWSLLNDVPETLELSFSGIMTREADGSYCLAHARRWPDACTSCIPPGDAFVQLIRERRTGLAGDDVRTAAVAAHFPHAPLAFAAPLFVDREVTALVLYGRSVSGLDLDPDERLSLVRLMSNASIALAAIELAQYRPAGAPSPFAFSDQLRDSG